MLVSNHLVELFEYIILHLVYIIIIIPILLGLDIVQSLDWVDDRWFTYIWPAYEPYIPKGYFLIVWVDWNVILFNPLDYFVNWFEQIIGG